mgnify:CR=1 FL=1
MIEAYLAEARKSRPASREHVAYYAGVYDNLLGCIKDAGDPPKLHVAYTIDRRSEFLILGGVNYIVHDQYLGQSFNALNRILFARHGSGKLSQSYACKFLAERFVTLGCHKLALLTSLLSHQFKARALEEGDPYDIAAEAEAVRSNITAVQEDFVLAHELSHFMFTRDQDNFRSTVRGRLEEFFAFKEVTVATDPSLTEEVSEQALTLGAQYYRQILEFNETDYLLELFADDFGGMVATQIALYARKIPLSQCCLGLVLTLKYTRLFRHLELMARVLAPLETIENSEITSKLMSGLDESIWDPTEKRIEFYQLREHVLQYSASYPAWGFAEIDETEPFNVSERIALYDELIEFPIIFSLVDVLKEAVSSGLLASFAEMAANPTHAVEIVDEMTGWIPRRTRGT